MSDAFTAAAAAIAADANLGTSATFVPKATGVPAEIRVVPSRPEAPFGGGLDGAPRAMGVAVSVMIPAAAVAARPAQGDALVFGGVAYVVMEVAQDSRAASWSCALRRA